MKESIIDPVDLTLIKEDLKPSMFFRRTTKLNNDIYIFHATEAPNLMKELGRLREVSFRLAGGGTGKSCDIDEFDLNPNGYKQLIVWDPREEKILGGYRYIYGRDILQQEEGIGLLATSHMFAYSEEFLETFLPYTIELGRSFVIPECQASQENANSRFVLDNLWDGLGALTILYPDVKHYFGKVTMYPAYNRYCRNLILHFLDCYFSKRKGLVYPIDPLKIELDERMKTFFSKDAFREDFKRLKKEVRQIGQNIPPLFSSYISLSPELSVLGTAINYEFGNVEETGILLTIDQMEEDKKNRYIDSCKS